MSTPRSHHFFSLARQLRSADWLLFLCVFTCVLLGLAAIYSVELSQEGSAFIHVQKQGIAIVLGSIAFVMLALSNFTLLQNYSLVFYVFCVCLLLSLLIFGETIRGSTGWFEFGLFRFQPVELMKISLVITLASFFTKRTLHPFSWKIFLESAAIVLVPVSLVLLQPDFGSASILLGVWFLFLLFAGIPWKYIGLLVLTLGIAFSLSWQFLFADYQRARIVSFLDPQADPLGQGYNVTQAIIAIGSGGWFGRGLGFGTQSQLKFLPESQTDFIFAVIAEELGFFGVSVLLAAFGFLFFRLGRHVSFAGDDFTRYLLLGAGSIFFLQFFVNVAMNLGLFPVTGVGLPFVSYGGSSLVTMLALVGIVQSIVIHCRIRHGGSGMVG